MKKVMREDVLKLICEVREKFGDTERNQVLIDDYNESIDDPEALYKALRASFDGVTNGFLSEIYEVIYGIRIEVIGETVELLRCPCCLRQTLSERFDAEAGTGWDICRLCGWEDDGTLDPEVLSSVNNGTISQYRSLMRKNSNLYYRERWLTQLE